MKLRRRADRRRLRWSRRSAQNPAPAPSLRSDSLGISDVGWKEREPDPLARRYKATGMARSRRLAPGRRLADEVKEDCRLLGANSPSPFRATVTLVGCICQARASDRSCRRLTRAGQPRSLDLARKHRPRTLLLAPTSP